MKIRVGLFAASPVYYQAPLYRRIANDPRVDFTAIFASTAGATRPIDNGFGKPVDLRVDALSGYRTVFLKRAEENPTGGGMTALHDLDVVREVVRGDYDVLWLHGYHTITHLLALIAQRLRRRPVLIREEQNLLSPRPLWKRAVKAFFLGALLRGSYGLYIGSENRRWFRRWGVPDDRLVHVPYVVDNAALREQATVLAPRRSELRRQFGIAEDAGPVILTVARLVEKKRPVHLVEAFRRVRQRQQCALLIVGSGDLEDEIRRHIVLEGIPDVVVAGFIDQTRVAEAYAAADLFVLPSGFDETWGLVVNEAMNFGLPIVATDRVGCATDLVQPDRNGFVVPFDDVCALAGAIERLVADERLRREFGAASLNLIAEWTYDAAAAGILEAVERAVGAQRWSQAAQPQSLRPGWARE